jgi:hypothetical protein
MLWGERQSERQVIELMTEEVSGSGMQEGVTGDWHCLG